MNTTASSPAQTTSTSVPFGRIAIAMGIRFLPILAAAGTFLAFGIPAIWLNIAIIGVDIVTLMVLHFLMKAEGKRLRDLFLPFKPVDIAWGLLSLLIIIVTWVIAAFIATLIVYQGQMPSYSGQASIPLWVGLSTLIVMPLTVAFAEEGLYRGYLQTRLSSRFGVAPGLILSALVFGIQHIGIQLPNIQGSAVQVITTAIAGLVFGGLMLWFKRTGPLVIAHWGLDVLFLGLPVFTLALAS